MKHRAPHPCRNRVLRDRRSLHQQAGALDEEIERGQTVSAACWDGDRDVVDETGDDEHGDHRDERIGAAPHWFEHIIGASTLNAVFHRRPHRSPSDVDCAGLSINASAGTPLDCQISAIS